MDALIGMTGLGLVFIGTPLSVIILISKLIKKNVTRKDKKRPVVFLLVGIAMFLIGILMSPDSIEITGEDNTATEITDNEVTTENEDKVQKSTEEIVEIEKDFKSELELLTSKDVAEKAYEILTDGIGFSKLEYNGRLDSTSNWKIKADEYDIILTASDEVYRIFIPNSSVVFYEDDKVIMTKKELEDRKIGQTERNAYYQMAQEIVRSNLKSPNSADFPSIVTKPGEIAMQKNGDLVAVQSYVDAINSFGAEIRSKWTVQYRVIDLKNYVYEVIFINLDGESSGKFIDME